MKREVWFALSVLALGGCSLTLGLDEQQPCSNDDDCAYSNGQGTCEDSFCVPPGGSGSMSTSTGGETTNTSPTSTTNPTTTTTPGTDTTETTDASETDPSTDTDTNTDTDSVMCLVNTDCSSDERCGPDNTCLGLLSAECQSVQYPDDDDFDRDTVVFIGSIFPSGGAFKDLVQPLVNAVQLAVEDFNDNTTLQGDRQIAWVSCDSTAGVDAAVDAATHLADNVGTPAIIGPAFSESVLAVATNVTIGRGVFIVTPTATATSITELNDSDLVWRTIAPDTYQANGIIDRMTERRAEDTETRMERLLVLAKDDAYGTGLLGGVQADLEALLPADRVHIATYENPASFGSQEELLASYGATIGGAFGVLPAVYENREDHYTDILFVGTSETQALLYGYFSAWALTQPPLPRFHFSHGSVPELERMVNEIGPTPGTEGLVPIKQVISDNIEGISPVIFDELNFTAFNIRYRIRFNNEDALSSAALSYDATLATLFAMSAAPGDEEITGADIATAYTDLMDPAGTDVSFSGSTFSFITEARNAMAVEGGSVDLQGVSGELTWDAAGDIRTGLVGWILDDQDDDPVAVDPRLDANRTYVLDKAPAATGAWLDL
ncbi:MAG: ABC transporter substrate-binding protein [Nannocystaceae bacterium]|nr:ABC transporter substrate-binding protein [Nannocystaceae bacterium]